MDVAVGIVAGFGAAAWAMFRWRTSGFAWSEFAIAVRDVDAKWLAASVSCILVGYLVRAIRWEVMLKSLRSEDTPGPGLGALFTATAIGFTAVVLFGRAGEPVRPYLIARKAGVSFSSQIAAWVMERILDLLMVLLIFGAALTQASHSVRHPGPRMQLMLRAGGYASGFTGLACLALLIALLRFQGQIQTRLLDALAFLPEAWISRARGFLASFEQGIQSARQGASPLLLGIYTVAEWAVIAATFGCTLRAFPATSGLDFTGVLILLGFVSFGSAVQIPGVGGGMQIMTVLILTECFGLNLETASGIALVLWIVMVMAVVPLGLILAFREGLQWKNLRHLDASPEVPPLESGPA